MKLFRFPKRDPKRFEEDTPVLKVVRLIILVLLFGAVVLGVWLSGQRQAAMRMKSDLQRIDETGFLTEEQKKLLASYSEKFLNTYGLAIVIRIQDEAFPETVLPADKKVKTLFFGLSPRNNQVHLEIPPLAAASLGDQFISYLRDSHFPPYFSQKNWPEGLASALSLLTEKLDQSLSGPEASKPNVYGSASKQ